LIYQTLLTTYFERFIYIWIKKMHLLSELTTYTCEQKYIQKQGVSLSMQ